MPIARSARSFTRTSIALACTAALLSCASVPAPFAPDFNARAPHLEGYGSSSIAITTRSEAARKLFNEGVLQAYAFNENEAVRTFKAALAQDPDCAMCAWGVAWQLGPNINDSGRREADAVNYVDYALKRLANATPRERALVEALAIRYAHESTAKETAPLVAMVCGKGAASESDDVKPLDAAYADRMRKLADAYPMDADILSLYAEAELIATPGDDAWTADGKPVGRVGEVADRLERLLAMNPSHTGINHYMIHMVDDRHVAHRAVAAADRLGKLAPLSPHLVHMPAHTFVNVGRYADAVRVNESAVAADATLAQTQKAQGFETTKDWRGHNQHFLWYASLMAEREDAAMTTALAMREMFPGTPHAFAEYVNSLPLVTLVRFEQWDKILAQPKPEGDRGISQLWFEYARGVAQARLGRLAEADATLVALKATATGVKDKYTKSSRQQRNLRAMADTAQAGLQAEVALAKKQFDEAGQGGREDRRARATRAGGRHEVEARRNPAARGQIQGS
ncbi:hypothetical protein [Caenimonas koreensis]|uniref:hypothetical protein n=1 Tax=Caenimonas koreensis TaxID=367474 RepID=UPI0037839C42